MDANMTVLYKCTVDSNVDWHL